MFESNDLNEALRESETVFGEPSVLQPAILLHTCCGPCSTAVVEQLASRFSITLYFCNSNIDDEAEYIKRFQAQKDFVERYNSSAHMGGSLTLVCAPYAPAAFLRLVKGHESCPEGGARCRLCIEDRLEKTAVYAAMNGFDYFSTALTVSRHKNHDMIREIGMTLAMRYGLTFIGDDFKKGGGEKRSIELAKSYGLYRQNYCGCRFSKK